MISSDFSRQIPRRYDRLSRYFSARAGKEGARDAESPFWVDELRKSTVTVAGAGGLGGALIQILARYPIGRLRIIDRDAVDETNLGHQTLFAPRHATGDVGDSSAGTPKAVAAAEYVRCVNPEIEVSPVFDDLRAKNADALLAGSSIVLDGLDNFGTRYLINDWCLRENAPYVYGGIVEAEGSAKAVLPGVSSCLRCLMPEPPRHGETRTCDVYGIHLPVIQLAAAIMADLALTIILGNLAGENAIEICELTGISLENGEAAIKKIAGSGEKNPRCPACVGKYEFLDGAREEAAASICGRNAVALTLNSEFAPAKINTALGSDFESAANEYLVKAVPISGGPSFTIFSHGRVMMEGSEDISILRSFVSNYLGD